MSTLIPTQVYGKNRGVLYQLHVDANGTSVWKEFNPGMTLKLSDEHVKDAVVSPVEAETPEAAQQPIFEV